jgi:NADPH-dependent ferric siderophore reductase
MAQISPAVSGAARPNRNRVLRSAVVVRKFHLAPQLVRVVFTGEDLRSLPDMTFTDHYIKILFAPDGAGYGWPFDPDEIRAREPAERWPVTRTYTIRSFDPVVNEMAVDFVLHGDEGLAGPWAAGTDPGDWIGFFGPGGAYAPDTTAAAHLLVGDEAAIPAIAATLERLPDEAKAEVYVEVAGPGDHSPLPQTSHTCIHWVHREDRGYGLALSAAVRDGGLPAGRLQAFIHGNADMVKDLRRFLFVEQRIERGQVSISGYWRTGHTEDRWQQTKGEYNRQLEAEESADL